MADLRRLLDYNSEYNVLSCYVHYSQRYNMHSPKKILKLSVLAMKLYNKQRKEACPMNDRKALRELRAGSQEALIWIMNKYGGYVSTIVWNIIGPSMSIYDSEEVVSDVFLALWNSSSAIRTNSIKSYLAGIARNKAKMKLREAGHTLVLDCNIIELEISNPEDEYEKKELSLLVKKAIDQIKEPDREILLRYFYYYQTMDTISSEMGINLSTVKTKIRRGKDSIRTHLLSKLNYGGLL